MLLAASIAGLFLLPGPWNVILFGLAVFFEIGEVYLWIRFLERYRVRGGAEGMVGERATVVEECAPDGIVRVRGELWKARSEAGERLSAGERATVLAVEGLTVTVARDGAKAPSRPAFG
ncbi:MAG: NfeD family protein [Actinomycetota bacterium]|nr:NfeD family protein [Actinomycetota bacterium]